MGYTEKSRIEERKVRAGVSKRVAKCNLKKERTSSPTTTLSSPLTTRFHRSILGQRPGRRKRKVQSGLQFSSHTVLLSFPSFSASSSFSLALSPAPVLTPVTVLVWFRRTIVHFEFVWRASLYDSVIHLYIIFPFFLTSSSFRHQTVNVNAIRLDEAVW